MLRMAELLESVRGSVSRAAEVLEHLIHQPPPAAGPPAVDPPVRDTE